LLAALADLAEQAAAGVLGKPLLAHLFPLGGVLFNRLLLGAPGVVQLLEEALVIEQLLPVQRFAGALAQIVLVVFALVAGELLPHLLGGAEPGTGLAELARGRLLPHLRQAQQDGQSLRGFSFGHFSDSLSGQRPAAAPAGR